MRREEVGDEPALLFDDASARVLDTEVGDAMQTAAKSIATPPPPPIRVAPAPAASEFLTRDDRRDHRGARDLSLSASTVSNSP